MTPSDVAQVLLKKYWDGVLPVDPEFFAERMVIQVKRTSDMDEIGYFDEEARTIFVKATESPSRERYTIARELGHYSLGHGTSRRDTTSRDWILKFQKDAAVYGQQDNEANDFAGELLLPASVLRYFVQEKKILSIDELSQRFGVSGMAVGIRLLQLGLA